MEVPKAFQMANQKVGKLVVVMGCWLVASLELQKGLSSEVKRVQTKEVKSGN